jgi:hypothetical protein
VTDWRRAELAEIVPEDAEFKDGTRDAVGFARKGAAV